MTTPPSSRFSRNLYLVAFAPLMLGLGLVVAVQAMAATPAAAGDERPTVILHSVTLAPATRAGARRVYRRIDAAALAVCGGGDHSLAELNRAVRGSSCWASAMRDALAQINNPLLPLNLADQSGQHP